MVTVQTISPRHAQREKMKADRRREAVDHMNKRIKDLEVKCVNSGVSLYQKEQMRNSINFLTQVRDSTLYHMDVSLGNKPRLPKHQRVNDQLDQALEVDAAFASLNQHPQPDMSFLT